ncbi:MAG: ribosome maturation factor RimP [Acidimicrobiia bacterium]|nr:ribosome maturation factor RimP [Acidimicrobiia bacterium]
MSVVETVRSVVQPLCDDAGVDLFDIEHNGGVLRISVERGDDADGLDGPSNGVDMETLRLLTRAVSRALDEADPIGGRYTLEVSSPGLERTLRTPAHFRWARGKLVKVKTRPHVEGERRIQGLVTAADDDRFEITDETSGEVHRLGYDDVDKVRTVFEWGPTPKSGSGKTRRKASS